MRRALAALLVLAAPSFALAQSVTDTLDATAKGILHAALPPGDKPADAQAVAPPKAGDMVNNPPYAHWSQFKPGATVTVKEVDTQADGSVAEIVITSKLISKSKTQVKVETVVTLAGAGGSSSAGERTQTLEEYPAKVRYEQSQSPSTAGYSVTEGKESIQVKGKPVETEWVESTLTNGDEITVEKIWTTNNVPGGIVKQTMTRTHGTQVTKTSTELVDYKAKTESKKAH
jgi:hypothetical protein